MTCFKTGLKGNEKYDEKVQVVFCILLLTCQFEMVFLFYSRSARKRNEKRKSELPCCAIVSLCVVRFDDLCSVV